MRVLITGVTGLLGLALQEGASPDQELYGVYYPERPLPVSLRAAARAADVSNLEQMREVFAWAQPHVVIHTAAIGSVDFAEKNRDLTRTVNVGGTQVVTELSREAGAYLVYVSSNAVFDGNSPFYSETSPLSPINHYGQLKVEAERTVENGGLPWAIVRPILMYGWPYPGERDNPVTWWIRSLREGKPLKVVDNVYSKPLLSASCAEVLWAVIRQNRNGIFHAAGRDHLSLHDFCMATAQVFGLDQSLVEPVPDSYFPELAPRPRDTSFDTGKMEHELGVATVGVLEGLQRMKETEACPGTTA